MRLANTDIRFDDHVFVAASNAVGKYGHKI